MKPIDIKFDFDLDFDNYLEEINGKFMKTKNKKIRKYNVKKGTEQIKNLIQTPPTNKESIRLLSFQGGFSSINLILFIAEIEDIEELYISTLRIGRREAEELYKLYTKGKIKKIFLLLGYMQKLVDQSANGQGYFDYIAELFNVPNIKILQKNNHSKLLLMKTKKNYYTVETSSNLNDNPRIEQFCFENSKELFDFYRTIFYD